MGRILTTRWLFSMKSNQIKTGATPLESPPQTAFTLKIPSKKSAPKKSS